MHAPDPLIPVFIHLVIDHQYFPHSDLVLFNQYVLDQFLHALSETILLS